MSLPQQSIGDLNPVPTLNNTAIFEIEQANTSFSATFTQMSNLVITNLLGQANAYVAGFKQTFAPDVTNAGLNVH